MRRVLVIVPAMVALASCAEGSGGTAEQASGRRAKPQGSSAAICVAPPQTAGLLDAPVGVDSVPPDAPLADAPVGIDSALPDAPVADAPVADAPVADAPLADAPVADAPPVPDAPPGDGGMDCKGLDIVQAMISIVPMGMANADVQSVPGFTDQMVSASITGDGFAFLAPGCGPQLCDFTSMPHSLPFRFAIACNATDGMPRTGTLRVQGAQGPSDFDTASLECSGSANVPLINIAPSAIDAPDVPVGTASDHMFTVTNNGTSTLTFSIKLPAGAPEWTAPGSPCIDPGTCSVPPGGGMSIVGVQFLPTTHMPSSGTISITSNAGSRSIDVAGNGLGSRIVVTDPLDLDIDFGTIPRNSTVSRPIAVSAIGNMDVSLEATAPGAPFSVTPAQLTLTPGVPQELTVSCGSTTATGPVNQAIMLASPDAYDLGADSVAVHCEVASTQVSVTPSAFDFAEVRRGTAAAPLPFTIKNPGPASAMITSVELAGAPASLSMTVDGGAFPRTLPADGTITGRLSLTTDQDLDLARSAPKLRIAVDGVQLVYPVTGKVTTPAAYVTPEKLELGTACAGSGVTAMVSMINSGTARLTMEAPRVDPAFELRLESPPSYPAPLLAGTTAMLGVSPAAEAPGELTGTLTWAVDAPRSPFVVPVSLAFIETGTAISPASINFATVKVKEMSLRYMVTLQNCSAAPVIVTVDGVTATRGGMAAWKVEPSYDTRTLAPRDKLTISVAFAPLRHGRHVAQLVLGVDGEDRFVTLEGDAIDLDFKRTSFYACGCTSPRTGGGWPIALEVALVVLRGRRRSRRD